MLHGRRLKALFVITIAFCEDFRRCVVCFRQFRRLNYQDFRLKVALLCETKVLPNMLFIAHIKASSFFIVIQNCITVAPDQIFSHKLSK